MLPETGCHRLLPWPQAAALATGCCPSHRLLNEAMTESGPPLGIKQWPSSDSRCHPSAHGARGHQGTWGPVDLSIVALHRAAFPAPVSRRLLLFRLGLWLPWRQALGLLDSSAGTALAKPSAQGSGLPKAAGP